MGQERCADDNKMTLDTIKAVLKTGDNKGSALCQMFAYYEVMDFDFDKITDGQAKEWLKKRDNVGLG